MDSTAGARHGATISIAQTQVVAAHLGSAGLRLLGAASSSFVGAMHVTVLISVLIAVIGAITVWIWMPGRAAAAPTTVGHASRGGADGAEIAVAAPRAADG